MKNDHDFTQIEIFCGNSWQVGMVRTLLEDSGIRTYIRDEIMGTMNPWWTAPGGVGSIRLFISEGDYDKAKEIVRKYERCQNDEHNV